MYVCITKANSSPSHLAVDSEIEIAPRGESIELFAWRQSVSFVGQLGDASEGRVGHVVPPQRLLSANLASKT